MRACDEISCFYAHWPGGNCTIFFSPRLFFFFVRLSHTPLRPGRVCVNRPPVNCGGIQRILRTELLSIMIIIRTTGGCLPYRIGNLNRKPEPRRITAEPKANENRKCPIEQQVVRCSRRTVVFCFANRKHGVCFSPSVEHSSIVFIFNSIFPNEFGPTSNVQSVCIFTNNNIISYVPECIL